eukprot:jgi/Orpsp1_1/1184110/evm.model.c7180000088048.1
MKLNFKILSINLLLFLKSTLAEDQKTENQNTEVQNTEVQNAEVQNAGNQVTDSASGECGYINNWLKTNGFSNSDDCCISSVIICENNHITKIHIENSDITNIPPEIGNLTYLTELWLDHNKIQGSFPKEVTNLVNLRDLSFGANQLTGIIPSEIKNLVNLEK